jgi:hypothetical protein
MAAAMIQGKTVAVFPSFPSKSASSFIHHHFLFSLSILLLFPPQQKTSLKATKKLRVKVFDRAFYLNRSTSKRLIYLLLQTFEIHDISNNFNHQRDGVGEEESKKLFPYPKTQIKNFFIILSLVFDGETFFPTIHLG